MKAQHTFRYWARETLRHALPAGGWERLDRARRWRHYRRAGAIFVHVPKAAGSSIATALYGRRLGHHPARRLMLEDPAAWDALKKFSVLREPVSRLLSAFAYAISGGTTEGAIRWRAEYGDPALRDVNAFVLDYLGRGDLLDKDVVFWPQSHFVRGAAGEPVDGLALFAVEQPGPLAAWMASLGRPVPARVNRGQPAAGLKLEIGAEARRRLESLYSADFALLRALGKVP